MSTCTLLVASMGCLLLASPVTLLAEGTPDGCVAGDTECTEVGRWHLAIALGAGARSNPLAHSSILPLLALPDWSYYGKRVFLHNLDAGITVAATYLQALSLVATPGYDRSYFSRSDLQNYFVAAASSATAGAACRCTLAAGVADASSGATPVRIPRLLYMVGPEWTASLGATQAQFDVLHDVTGGTGGSEIRAAIAWSRRVGPNSLDLHAGFTWKSAGLTGHYYGVPGFYSPGASLNPFLKLGLGRPLGPGWTLRAFMDVQWLGSTIRASPLVARGEVLTGFVGATHEF